MHRFNLIHSICSFLIHPCLIWDAAKLRRRYDDDPLRRHSADPRPPAARSDGDDPPPDDAAAAAPITASPVIPNSSRRGLCDAAGGRGENRSWAWAVADLDGSLTMSQRPFPYYMLIALEAGSPVRALVLLLVSPLLWLIHTLASESLGLHLLIFISTLGVRTSEIEAVGRAVLCRFYLRDLHPEASRVFLSCGRRWVVTSTPRMMVEPFLKEFLGVERVVGTELQSVGGVCTGLVRAPGVLVGRKKREAVEAEYEKEVGGEGKGDSTGRRREQLQQLDALGIGDGRRSADVVSVCKEAYVVGGAAIRKEEEEQAAAAYGRMMKQALIFHDGRLVRMPTEVACACMCLWAPVGAVLAVARICVWVLLPVQLGLPLLALLGVRLRVQGGSPAAEGAGGVVYVCSHRSVMDGMALSLAVGRKTAVAIYSVSRVVELLIPMRAVRLARRRAHDAAAMRAVLRAAGSLAVCPEGTTCREPFLLRFSPLFAELGAAAVVPVGLRLRESLFHGSTARGLKMLDPFFFFMNPAPSYVVNILAPLHPSLLSRPPLEVANHVQALLARLMGYQCTQLTRRHKYRILAGNDGNIDPITSSSSSSSSSSLSSSLSSSSLPPS